MAEKVGIAASVANVLQPFLRPQDKAVFCDDCDMTELLTQATADLGCRMIHWDTRRNWHSLLRLVFDQRATVLIAEPKVILGLAKIARATGTPLPVRHAVLLGSNTEPWLLKGIRDGLDAQIHICDLPAYSEGDLLLRELDEMLLSWASVLDYHGSRTEQGLRLEIIVFPGHKLPKLPSGASVTVRPWRPGEDAPCSLQSC